MGKISIKDIAEKANVSSSTVSRIINEKGKYKQETIKAVWDAVNDLGYSPNFAAKSLRTSTSKIVGIFLPQVNSDYFKVLADKIIYEVIKEGFTPIVCVSFYDDVIESAYCRTLSSLNACAIIYIFKETPLKPEIAEIPAIFIGSAPTDADQCIRILFDIVDGAKMATDELIRAGCKRIIYCKSSRFRDGHIGRYLGYQQALWENALSVDEDLIVTAGDNEDCSIADAIEKLIQHGIQFDGIFANTLSVAIEAINHLHKNKINVPHDVKIVSLENGKLAELYDPTISAIEMNPNLTCESVISYLKKMTLEAKTASKTIRIPAVLFERKTTSIEEYI